MSQPVRNDADDLFEPVLTYPEDEHRSRFDYLVGMDATKDRLVKETLIRLDPDRLTGWSRHHHGDVLPVTAGYSTGRRYSSLPATSGLGRPPSPRASVTQSPAPCPSQRSHTGSAWPHAEADSSARSPP